VFDGESAQLHNDWVVLVKGEQIEAAGAVAEIKAPADCDGGRSISTDLTAGPD